MCAVSKQITIAARAFKDVKDIQEPCQRPIWHRQLDFDQGQPWSGKTLTLKACHVLARHFVKPAARSDLSDLLAAMLLGTFQDERPEHWVAAVR